MHFIRDNGTDKVLYIWAHWLLFTKINDDNESMKSYIYDNTNPHFLADVCNASEVFTISYVSYILEKSNLLLTLEDIDKCKVRLDIVKSRNNELNDIVSKLTSISV